jgi:gliding motility-associated-like protein
VSCFGDVNGSCYLQLSGGIPPYNQTWFGIDSSYLAPGTYPYHVTDAHNCVKNGNVTIYEPDTLRAEATIIDVDCYGEENGAINLNITGGTAPFILDFGIFNQYALAAGTYPFTITDAHGCTFDSASTVNQANEISLDFIAVSPICRYDQSTLSIHISNSLSNTYTMSLLDSILKSFVIDTNGLLIPDGLPITLTPNFSGEVYIVSLTDDQGCTRNFNEDVHIEVKQLPELNLNEDDLCVGELSYTLDKATPNGGTYFINNIMTNYFDIENLETGGYSIKYEYTDPITSCYNEISEIITINKSPKAGMLFSPQPANIDDPNILFRNNSNEEILMSEWHLGDSTIIYDELSFWHTYADTGTYMIKYYITNIYGCTDSVINLITINPIYSVFIPDAFTPNNDNNNDYFYPSITGEKNYNMKIYNRWGEVIYNEDNGKWDGTINDKLIPTGIYSYSISIFDFNDRLFIYPGLVTLLR